MYSPKARRRVLRDEESCGQEEAELCVEIIKETSTDSWQQTGEALVNFPMVEMMNTPYSKSF